MSAKRLHLKAFLFIPIFLIQFSVTAQVMVSPTGKPASLVICSSPGTFSLQIANTTGSTMTGATLTVDLPPGCYYVQGSVTGATELSIANPEQPVFSLPPIANNTAHSVTYDARIICGYTNTVNFVYQVSYNSSVYSGFDTPLQNYYYPEPVITQITNGTAVIPVGQSITRNITIEQQGLNSSLDTLILLDEHTTDIQVLSVTLGTLHPYIGPGPLIVDTIILTGSNFPGGNGKFDAGESIVVGEIVKLTGCSNGQSTLKAGWGCLDQTCNQYSAFPSVSPAAGNPSVTIAFTPLRRGWGFIDNSGWMEFNVTNSGTGAGTAFDIIILAGFSSGGSTYYPNGDWINEIDSFSVNGNYLPASFNYAAGATNGQYAHYTNCSFAFDPDGTGTGLEDMDGDGFYDDLPPGKTVTVRAHTYYDWPEAVSKFATGNTCGYGWTNSAYQAFRFGYKLNDQCQTSSGVNWIPNTTITPFMTYNTNNILTEIPSDLYDNTPVWYEQTVSTSSAVNNEGCPNDSVVYKVVLPPGVTIATGYTATFKGVSMGAPQIIGDTAKYFLDKNRILSGGLFRVPVVLNCSIPHSSTGYIHSELKFWCDKVNYKSRFFTYWCGNSPVFGIQCPVANCPDPSSSMFVMERQTMGWTNEQCTTKVSRSTPGLRLDHAFARDTVRGVLYGKLHGPVDSLYFQMQHDNPGGAWANQFFLDYVADTIKFYNAETGTWHICPGLSPQITNGATSYWKTYLGNLTAMGNCFDGINYSDGDSVIYIFYATVKNIAQTEWRTVGGLRAGFVWQDQNVLKKCNDIGCTFSVNGSNYPLAAGTNYQQIVLSGCSAFVYEGMIYRSLDICGGDIAFPGEVRPYCVLDTMTFTLPEGFVYQPGTAIHSIYKIDGSYKTEVIPDPVITPIAGGTSIRFIRDNTWGYSAYYDCSMDHERIRFNATPSCKANGNYTYSMDARGRYQFYIDRNGIYKASTANVAITYTPPLMELTPLITTAEGREDTAVWEIRICNSRSFGANDSWLAFENLSQGINIHRIIDVTVPASPQDITFLGYGPGKVWFQAGDFSGSECKFYEIKGTYTSCSYDSILVRHGYNCAGYPMNPSLGYNPGGYICSENTSYLYLDPKDVSLNVTITSPANPVNLCDTLLYTTEVTNSQLSYGYDNKFTVAIPPGVTILPGSSEILYPINAATWIPAGDPVNEPLLSNKWVYHLSDDPAVVPFLKGVDSIPYNGYKIRFKVLTDCNFTSGTGMKLTASSSNACGAEKTRTSYTQPIHIYDLPTNVNLYVINTQVPGQLYTCSEPSLIKIKVINLGPSSVSQIEKLGFNLDDAFDYVANSLVGIHNGPTGIASNTVTGGTRYINFAIQPNLAVNDSIVFTFLIQDIDPASLVCDSIILETTTLLVAEVDCQTAPGGTCLIQSITSMVQTSKPVIKDIVGFGSYSAQSTPSGTNGENVTITYHIKNTGPDTLHMSSLNVYFFWDENGNSLADDPSSDSLFSQILPIPVMPPGDSVLGTASFFVPSNMTCRVFGAIRLMFNGCICSDATKFFNIRLLNAGNDTSFCVNSIGSLGYPATTGYTYIWLPTDHLDDNTAANPEFHYPGPLTIADTLVYTLLTTRSSNCLSQDTIVVVVNPRPAIMNTDMQDSLCSATTTNIQPISGYPGTTYSWDATASSSLVSGYSAGTGILIAQMLYNSNDTDEVVSYHVIPWYQGCSGDTAHFAETVHALASVIFDPPGQTICGNTACTIQLSSTTPGTGFTWTASSSPSLTGYTPGGGNLINQVINNSFYLPGQVFYLVTPDANGCSGMPATVSVTVNPLPFVNFPLCRDGITTANASPYRLKGATPPGGWYSGPGTDTATGLFSPAVAGVGSHQVYYNYINVYGCSRNDTMTIQVLPDAFSGCGNDLTDVRDGTIYPTIFLGSRCWTAGNLNYGASIFSTSMQTDNCIIEKYCYGNSIISCNTTGGLYQWDEMMQYEGAQDIQGICPPGWHVPTVADWQDLFSVFINEGFAGSPLKFSGFSGFSALLSGAGFANRQDHYSGWAGFYWTSTQHAPDKAWSHALNTPDPSVATYPSRKMNAFSVRCVKN